jgi:hypothetical protein
MGVFEVTGGHISAWRDYFDSAELPAVLGQQSPPAASDREGGHQPLHDETPRSKT